MRLDRIPEDGAASVRFDRVHVLRADARVRECGADHPLLRQAVRRGKAVRGTVLIQRSAPHHRQHLVPEPPRVRQSLKDEYARAFGHAHAIGGCRERLAPAVGGEPALPGHP
jgi:hypothetical protein